MPSGQGRHKACPYPHLADLFPDRLVDSELGEIPEGWEVTSLGKICNKPQYGFTASAQDEPIGPKFLRIADINKQPWIEWSDVPHCEIAHDKIPKYQVHVGDILIARMADPGHGVMIEEDMEAVFASYLIRFQLCEEEYRRYVQYWLNSTAYWTLVRARQAGTTRATLNAKVLSNFPLIVPTREVAHAFSRVVTGLRERVNSNVQESRTLAAIRDALLPKLLSGEIRVGEAERILGRCM